MSYKTKAVPLELKELDDSGTFTGYGSVFSVTDYGNDVVEPGAFEASIKAWKNSGRAVPALWQHKTDEPIGTWTELSEDDHGLLGKAELWLDESPYARIAHKGMQTKAITGLSIGYRVKRESFDRKNGVNRLHELELVEISVVTNPMNDFARVSAVKSIDQILKEGRVPSLPEFEDFLCEAGFSRTQAKAIAGNGLRKLLDRCEADGKSSDVLEALKSFRL